MRMLDKRYRGFRIINFLAIMVLLGLMLDLYLAKTRAAADSAAIARTERQIVAERREIRALQVQVAGFETPSRIETLASQYLEMGPPDARHELRAEALPLFAPKPAPVAAPAVDPAQVAMNPAPAAGVDR